MPYYMHELNPDYNPCTGLLQHLSTDELKILFNEDDLLDTMIDDLPQVKRGKTEREMLLTSNKSLAEYNLSQEPGISSSKNQLKETYNQLMQLKSGIEEKKQRLDSVTRQMSFDTTLALLQTAAAESEEESEEISDSFLSGNITVENFIEQYLKKRKCAHLRRIKAEKMAELLKRRVPPQPALQNHSFQYPSYTPYPLPAQGGMPMPYFR